MKVPTRWGLERNKLRGMPPEASRRVLEHTSMNSRAHSQNNRIKSFNGIRSFITTLN